MDMFKKLVARALALKSQAEYDGLCGDVDVMYQMGKISWQEHELMYKLLERVDEWYR